jgi:hypothetical protein
MIDGDKVVDIEALGKGLPNALLHASRDGAKQRVLALLLLCVLAFLLTYALGLISF